MSSVTLLEKMQSSNIVNIRLMFLRADLNMILCKNKNVCTPKTCIPAFAQCPLSSLPQVIEGYEQACKKTLEILPDCVCSSVKNLHDVKEATSLIRTAVISKQYGNEDFLASLIAEACGESAIQNT